ncbi:hypothetical protein QL093DRAFT_2418901 [Fusarium oxysporum]|nr:hypothetical protein QL093DRAFT_2418901 [Fusarium oxysporum]
MDILACFVLPRLIILAWMVSVCIATRQRTRQRHRNSLMVDAERQEHELRDSTTYAYYLR